MKMVKYCFVLFLVFCFFTFPVSASTNTFTRGEDNLLISSDIVVTDQNLDAILSTPAVDASEKVYDFADLLTGAEEEKIYQKIKEFIDESDFDLAVVTIGENNKNNAMEYADDFFDYNDFGIGEDHSGILFLVDMDTREIYMSTSGRAKKMYSSIRIEKIMNHIFDYFSNGDYDNGITKFVTILENYDTIGLPSNKDNQYVIGDEGEIYREFPWVAIFGMPLLITAFIIGIMIYKNKLVRVATSSKEYLDKESLHVKTVKDILISTHTTVVPHSTVNTSGSGGSSGHSGSSGISHGGGGHRF